MMNCKRYTKWINDAAFGAPKAPRGAELRRHLMECPSCQRKFERERRLLAALDQALKYSPVSDDADLEARLTAVVRQRIAGGKIARMTLGFRFPVAAAAVLAVLALCVLDWRARRPAINQAPRISETAAIESSPGLLRPMKRESRKNTGAAPSERALPRAQHRRNKPARHPASPEVLVPKDEMALVLELYNGARTGKIDGASLLATPPGFKREKDGTLASVRIEIEPIKITKLKLE